MLNPLRSKTGQFEISLGRAFLRNPWLVLLVTATGQGMVTMGAVILAPALPLIAEDFNTTLSDAQWVAIAYGITQPALVPLAGRLSDLFERKDAFLAGILLFTIGSVLGSQSFNVEFLIFARLVQALGGVNILANSFAIVTDVFPPQQRGLAIGIVVGMIGIGGASGLVIGGTLASQVNWESTFFILIALGLVVLLGGALVLPRGLKSRRHEPIDWAGGLLLAGALGTLLLGITKGQEWGWTSTSIVGLFGLTAMLSIAFLSVERTVSHPIVDLGEFKSPVLAATNVGALFGLVPLGAFVFLMPFYLQGPQGYSAQESGLIMIPYPLANILGAAVSGRLARRFLGPGVFSSMGLALIIIGFFLMAEMDSDAGIADIAWRSAIAGAGLGAFQAANTEVVMGSVGPQKRGSASGVLSMFQQTGANVGTAVSGLILSIVVSKEFEGLSGSTIVTRRHFAQLAGQPEQLQELTDAFMNGFGRAFLAMATFAAVAILLSLVTVVRYKREQPAAVPLAPRGMSAEPADLSGSGATE